MDNTCKAQRKRKILEVLSRLFKTTKTSSGRPIDKRVHRPTQTIRANFSLLEIRSSRFPGRQDAATCLCALLQSKCLSPSSWSTQVLDRLLLQGDKLHTTRLHHLGRLTTGDGSLTVKDLPTNFSTRRREFSISFTNIPKYDNTLRFPSDLNNQGRISGLKAYMKRCILDGHDGILLSGESTVAAMKDGSHYYIFHPCFVRRKPFNGDRQEPVLMKFCDIDHMISFILGKLHRNVIHVDVVVADILAEDSKWSSLTLTSKSPTLSSSEESVSYN